MANFLLAQALYLKSGSSQEPNHQQGKLQDFHTDTFEENDIFRGATNLG